tara:strand:+ start:5058 stop:5678 length:621 start_codon:yes stop_codon:yes gene_type:complete
MQNKNKKIVLVLILISSFQLHSQYDRSEPNFKECFVGSTFAMLGNLLPEEKPDFIQLNIGYRITDKDVVSLELKTWKYYQPLGLPFGDMFNAPEENFPGYIQEKGFALVYQRFLWKGWYTAIHVMSAWQEFIDTNENKIDDGFQVFNTYRLGYHFKLFKGAFFIEPSFAITHRIYHTEMPEPFKIQDDKYSKFFFGEPGLHFGFNF